MSAGCVDPIPRLSYPRELGTRVFRSVMPSDFTAPWCSGLTRLPVKEEIGSSNLLGVATLTNVRKAASPRIRSNYSFNNE